MSQQEMGAGRVEGARPAGPTGDVTEAVKVARQAMYAVVGLMGHEAACQRYDRALAAALGALVEYGCRIILPPDGAARRACFKCGRTDGDVVDRGGNHGAERYIHAYGDCDGALT